MATTIQQLEAEAAKRGVPVYVVLDELVAANCMILN
jgi:hypothetical protein